MNKKEQFKAFVKKNPSLIRYIKTGDMSWQKYYEIYDLYGDEEGVWKDYIKKDTDATFSSGPATDGFISWLKTLDLDLIQNGVQSVQRVLSVIGDFGTKEKKQEEYKPRPMYKHFED